jgi:hypothetical protein
VVVTSLKRSLRQLQKEIKDLEDIVVGFGKTGSSRFVNAIKNYT